MEFRNITFDDKPLVQSVHDSCGFHTLPFALLYCWKEKVGPKILTRDNWYAVLSETEKAIYYPCGDKKKTLDFISDNFSMFENGYMLANVPEAAIADLQSNFPKLEITEDHDSKQYIYKLDSLANLEGGDYKRFRSKLRAFTSLGEPSYEPIDDSNISHVKKICEIWQSERGYDDTYGDILPQKTAVDNFEALGFSGILVRMNGEYVGFFAGVADSKDTVYANFGKTTANNGADIYGLVNYCKTRPSNFTFLNFEEDMGHQGLREHKMRMHPCRFIRKFIGRI